MILRLPKKELAELVEVFVQLSSVTFNENDDRDKYVAWKMFCGDLSNRLTDCVKEWNDEAMDKFKIPEELSMRLNSFYNAYEEANDKLRSKLLKKYSKDLDAEKEIAKKLDEEFASEVDFEFKEYWNKSDLPLNINGSYLDRIKGVLR